MENIEVDGLLRLQAEMQAMSLPIVRGTYQKSLSVAHEHFQEIKELLSGWTMPQLYALHRMAFGILAVKAPGEPCQGLEGYCGHRLYMQTSQQLQICSEGIE